MSFIIVAIPVELSIDILQLETTFDMMSFLLAISTGVSFVSIAASGSIFHIIGELSSFI